MKRITNPLQDLAVIIPIAPEERSWETLLHDLRPLPSQTEILLVGPKKPEERLHHFLKDPAFERRLRWVSSPQGRGVQLNTGAKNTQKKFLWFLHADSRLEDSSLPALENSLSGFPNSLHYFILKFLSDGPALMWINEIGCYIRSRFMGAPFGDQGFCLSRDNFRKIGGFPEEVLYGEDHLFVWAARHRGIPLQCTGAVLKTSARRYAKTGWGALTLRYAQRWIRQAYPEWVKILRQGRIA